MQQVRGHMINRMAERSGMDKRVLELLAFLWLLGLSISDVRYRRVSVWMILLGGVPAVGMEIWECARGESGFTAFLAGMIPGTVLFLLALGTRKAGWADGIVLAFLGIHLGLRECLMAVMVSLLAISFVSAVLLVLKKVHKGTTIPYIPFLTLGFAACELMGG